jgi:hypothetical protein
MDFLQVPGLPPHSYSIERSIAQVRAEYSYLPVIAYMPQSKVALRDQICRFYLCCKQGLQDYA